LKIELLCSGTELLCGKLNTNAAFIGQKLAELGLELSAITSVSDRKEEFAVELKRALERSSVIITTGGLGPTFDDITVETASKCLGMETYVDEKIIESINKMFEKRGLTAAKVNERQANVIKGAKILENRFGTAPGQMIHFEYADGDKKLRKTLFLLPGPPREMQPIFERDIVPYLKSYTSGIRKSAAVNIFGLPESKVEEMIKPVLLAASFGDEKSVEFAILASLSGITVKFSVFGLDEMLVDETASNIKFELENILKDNIYGYSKDTLSSVVGNLLLKNKRSLSCAESISGGLLSSKITDSAGSSAYFKNSFIAYSNESKIKFLGVKEETIKNFGAVSEETAKEMALGCLKESGSDYAVSLTGIAGPEGGSKEKPVGLVYIGIASKKTFEVYKNIFSGSREEIKEKAANTALDLLRRKLITRV
jgi:nicotinamide-nucleotide amidase